MSAPNWVELAVCRNADIDVWYRDEFESVAITLCGMCPVRQSCLDDALEVERKLGPTHAHGIRGGETALARANKIRAERKAAQRAKALAETGGVSASW